MEDKSTGYVIRFKLRGMAVSGPGPGVVQDKNGAFRMKDEIVTTNRKSIQEVVDYARYHGLKYCFEFTYLPYFVCERFDGRSLSIQEQDIIEEAIGPRMHSPYSALLINKEFMLAHEFVRRERAGEDIPEC
jgi:hypothetical protein